MARRLLLQDTATGRAHAPSPASVDGDVTFNNDVTVVGTLNAGLMSATSDLWRDGFLGHAGWDNKELMWVVDPGVPEAYIMLMVAKTGELALTLPAAVGDSIKAIRTRFQGDVAFTSGARPSLRVRLAKRTAAGVFTIEADSGITDTAGTAVVTATATPASPLSVADGESFMALLTGDGGTVLGGGPLHILDVGIQTDARAL